MSNWVDLLSVPLLPDGRRYQALEWVKTHCPSYITNDIVQKHGEDYYRFYFGDEQDRMMFQLRWS